MAKTNGDNETVGITIKGEKWPFHCIPITTAYEAFFRIEDRSDSIHTNQTGAFPFTSQQGNRYIMVAIHLNEKNIFVEPMHNRSKEEIIRAYKKIINRMRLAGLGLKKYTLDNKALEAFNQCIQGQQMQYKLVPLGNHLCSQAEHMIHTFKVHFISILAGVDNNFLLSVWCHLLEPTELTLNLLRQSKVAPKVSTYAHIHVPHNNMKKPFAPLSWAIQAHIKLEDCRTWHTQSDAGFSLGMSIEHHSAFGCT
jgi:hypothetical protein